ncbi:MAG: methyl-accepting chemotaxis protein [Eubacteriales bacterium]|nr:methyl-accepting chemotaxis protein [Eubacteriales bacterium]
MGLFNRSRIIEYQKEQIARLEKNLKNLAEGQFDHIDLEISQGDDWLSEERLRFLGLNKHLYKIIENLSLAAKDKKEQVTDLKALCNEVEALTNSIMEGNLDFRIDTSKFTGTYSRIGEDINTSIEGIITPLNEAGSVIDKLTLNDYTLKMKGDYQGGFLQFSNAINVLIDRLLSVEDAFSRIANGDTTRLDEFLKVGKRSENDRLMPAAINTMQAIQKLIMEIEEVAAEAVNGDIKNAKLNIDDFTGEYKKIASGFNNVIKAMQRPLEETLQILTKMAVNDYTVSMNTNYMGDFLVVSNSINDVQKRLFDVQNIAVKIAKGDISELENFRKVGKRSENDHLSPALISMMETIENLFREITGLAGAAEEGNLNVRGDVSKFEGEYIKIIEGMNATLEAVVKPLKEVTDVMEQLCTGNLGTMVEGDYKGDYAILTNSVNTMIKLLTHIINEIGSNLTEIAQGNLDIPEIREYKGNFGDISDSLNKIINALNEIMRDINTAAEQTAVGAEQISDSSQILSRGSEEQASSIEEVTSSITEMAVQVKQNAGNANQANELSLTAKVDAEKGDEQMKEMLQAMFDINESSSNISKIIKVIDEIAFQTNILALNAAVEAARAGQYGKGFAVVAEEVRNLAQRSASAAKETTTMIEDSIEKVDAGTKIANNTAQALNDIVESITKANVLVGQITEASNEQAEAISQVNQAIEQVSQVIQTNSATAEEGASASEELSGQAEILKQMISHFKLKNSEEVKALNVNRLEPVKTPADTPQIVLDDRQFGKY